jgi:tRNA (guanine6-N2)-methyltransferase
VTAALVVARTVRGIEDVVAAEVRRLGLGRVERVGHREVWFRCADPGPDVLALRAADDVFLVAAEVGGVGRAKASLRLLSEAAAGVDVRSLVRLRERCGGFGGGGVDVSASFLGRRNYTRYDVEDAVGVPLAAASGVPYSDRRAGRIPPSGGLSWRVTISGDRALLALRVGDRPLHRRGYRVASRPGSLHPPLAAAMVALAAPRPGDRVLDPFCGTGTIPIEAAVGSGVVHNLRIVAGDRDVGALASAVVNADRAAASYPTATRSGDHDAKMYENGVLVPRLKTSGAPRPTPDRQPDPTTRRSDSADYPPDQATRQPDPTTREPDLATRVAHRITWTTADAAHLPLADHTIDVVVTNPPWSRQVAPTGTLADEPHRLWRELRRVLRSDGRALLLLPDVDGHAADAQRAGLVVTRRWPVSLSGMHPEVVELAPRG